MIIDQFKNLSNYAAIHPEAVQQMIEFFSKRENYTEPGKHLLDGDRAFALVQEFAPFEIGSAKVETHRRYIDIHVPLHGDEEIWFCPIESLELLEDLTPKSDAIFHQLEPGKAIKIRLPVGYFIWLNPGEGHVPGLKHENSPDLCRKIVFKVLPDKADTE